MKHTHLFLAVGCVIKWTHFTFRSWLSDMIGGHEFFQLLLSRLGSIHVLVPVHLSLLEKASGLLKWPGALPASLPGRSVFHADFHGVCAGLLVSGRAAGCGDHNSSSHPVSSGHLLALGGVVGMQASRVSVVPAALSLWLQQEDALMKTDIRVIWRRMGCRKAHPG